MGLPPNITLGKKGEALASSYLTSLGYKLLEVNFRLIGGEIDIIGIENDSLVFIEVKTRKSKEFGTPEEALTPWKLKRLIKSAYFYKHTHKNLPDSLRIDLVAIIFDETHTKPSISLYKNITG